MDDEVIGGVVAVFVVVLLVLAVIFGANSIANWSRDRTTVQCKERYGNSWVGKYASHGPNFCVNTDGSVKYLQ